MPQLKLFLACNHKPIVRGTDLAIGERIKVVPFTVTIPPEERDKDLGTRQRGSTPGDVSRDSVVSPTGFLGVAAQPSPSVEPRGDPGHGIPLLFILPHVCHRMLSM